MTARVCLLATLLAAPAFAEEPAPAFDLNSEAVRKVVREVAETQHQPVRIVEEPKKTETTEFRYVPPGQPEKKKEATPRLPDPPKISNDFVSSVVDILVDELLDTDYSEVDGIDAQAFATRCRLEHGMKMPAPGQPDPCGK